MNTRYLIGAVTASIALACANSLPSPAGTGQPLTVRVGYFNMAEVKASVPVLATYEKMRFEAESQLYQAVSRANDELAKAKADKTKTEAEITALQHDMQLLITGRQAALNEMVSAQQSAVLGTIAAAANAVAKAKQLDLIVDTADGVLAGGSKIVDSGLDVTELVKKQLQSEPTKQTDKPAAEKSPDDRPADKTPAPAK